MPTYTYKCPKCGETAELVRPVHARDKHVVCYAGPNRDRCATKMERQIEAPSVHFKGDGWTPKFHGESR